VRHGLRAGCPSHHLFPPLHSCRPGAECDSNVRFKNLEQFFWSSAGAVASVSFSRWPAAAALQVCLHVKHIRTLSLSVYMCTALQVCLSVSATLSLIFHWLRIMTDTFCVSLSLSKAFLSRCLSLSLSCSLSRVLCMYISLFLSVSLSLSLLFSLSLSRQEKYRQAIEKLHTPQK